MQLKTNPRDPDNKRVLVVGDLHFWYKGPEYRSDDYLESALAELDEILAIAQRLKVDAMFLLGDIFHYANKRRPRHECTNEVLRRLHADPNGLPWNFRRISLIGNHDIDNSMAHLPISPFGTLVAGGAIEIPEAVPELGIGCHHFSVGLETQLEEGLLEGNPYPIQALHAYAQTMPSAHYKHVLFKDLRLHPNVKLVLAGHNHHQMTETRRDGVRYINPGSITRNECTPYHIERIPQVVLLDYRLTPDGLKLDSLETTFYELKSSRPGSEIFRVMDKQTDKDRDADTRAFIRQVSQLSAWSKIGDNEEQWIRTESALINVAPDVIDMVIEYIDNARANSKNAA